MADPHASATRNGGAAHTVGGNGAVPRAENRVAQRAVSVRASNAVAVPSYTRTRSPSTSA
ncbi:MAG: hypothetical protein ACRELB_11710 [Polyangiaceae bacterium]